MSIESVRPSDPSVEQSLQRNAVEKKRRNEQLTPAERMKGSLLYSGLLGTNLLKILKGERTKQEMEKMEETSLILRRGVVLGRVGIGEAAKGKNSIDVRQYALEGALEGEFVVAFAKTEAGQRVFSYDERTKEVTGKQGFYREAGGDPAERVLSIESVEPDHGEKAEVPGSWGNVPGILEVMARHYGVDIEHLPKPNPKEFTHRLFIKPDHPPRAERVAYLHAEFFGLKGIPVTELRASEGVVDTEGKKVFELDSIQQMAPPLDKNAPMEPISLALKNELEGSSPGHPLYASLNRMAALHSITSQTDGHSMNVLAPRGYLEKNKSDVKPDLYAIDFGLAYPPVTSVDDVQDHEGRSWKIDRSPHEHFSYPQYIVENNPDWKLDDETRAMLKKRVEACRAWMELYDRDPQSTALDKEIPEVDFLLDSFLFLRGYHLEKNNEKREALMKIAKRDMRGQLNMVDYIATNGRPPDLKRYGLSQNMRFDTVKRRKSSSPLTEEKTGASPVRKSGVEIRQSKEEPPIDVTGETVIHTGSNPFIRR